MNPENKIAARVDGEVAVEYVTRVNEVRKVSVGSIALGVFLGNIMSAFVIFVVATGVWWLAANFVAAQLLGASSSP